MASVSARVYLICLLMALLGYRPDTEEVLDAIEEALQHKQMSAAAALGLAVGNPSLIMNRRHRRAEKPEHPIENLQKLADVLGLEFYLGPPRETGPVCTRALDGAAHTPIPCVDPRIAAGAESHDVKFEEALAFRRDWLRKRGVLPDQACLLQLTAWFRRCTMAIS